MSEIKERFSTEMEEFLKEVYAEPGANHLFYRGLYNGCHVGIAVTFIIDEFELKIMPMKLSDNIGVGHGRPIYKTFKSKSNTPDK